MPLETIFADFNGCAEYNRIRIYPNIVVSGIDNTKVEFTEGKEVWLSDNDELLIKGIIKFSDKENMWHWEFDP
jgi:hypothetical protein